MENFDEYLKSIPFLLEWFVPGYCTIYLYKLFRKGSEQLENSDSIRIVRCICVSFVLNAVSRSIDDFVVRICIEIVIGCVAALGLILLRKNRWVRRIYSKINHTTIADSVLETMELHLQDQWVTVFLKDGSMVYGRSCSFGDDEKDLWLSIDCYRTSGPLFDNNNGKVDEWNETEDKSINHIMGIRYSEIAAIVNHKTGKS